MKWGHWGSCAALLLIPSFCWALNVQSMRPAIGEMQGHQVSTSDIIPTGHVQVSMDVDYVEHPLEVGAGGSRFFGIVDRFVTVDTSVAVGIMKRLSVGVSVPINAYHNIAPILIPSRDTGGFDLGDMLIGAKVNLVGTDSWDGPGVAAYANVIVPTGDGSIYFGDSNVGGEIGAVVDKQLGRHRLALNVGARLREEESFLNLNVSSELIYGAAYHLDVGKKKDWKIVAELTGSTVFKKFFSEEVGTPLTAGAHVTKSFGSDQEWKVHLGANAGLTTGYGAPDYRVFSGVQFNFGAWKPSH